MKYLSWSYHPRSWLVHLHFWRHPSKFPSNSMAKSTKLENILNSSHLVIVSADDFERRCQFHILHKPPLMKCCDKFESKKSKVKFLSSGRSIHPCRPHNLERWCTSVIQSFGFVPNSILKASSHYAFMIAIIIVN